jgi:ribosomal protein S18 acetylase RimI-like enzyme
MKSPHIRPVGLADVDVLAELSRRTFIETFAAANTPEDMAAHIAKAYAADKLAAELKAPGSSFFFIELDDEPVGYLKVNAGSSQTDRVDGDTLEVERIYVAAEHQGRRLGKTLLEFAIDLAVRQGRDAVWLGVWEKNAKAMAFYERRGFVRFGAHDYVVGSDVQVDFLMRLALD